MIEAYLEENPNDARIIVQKVILARNAAAAQREMVQRKTVMVVVDCQENYLIVQSKIPKCEVYLVEEIGRWYG
jgi:DNA gyrase subunit B